MRIAIIAVVLAAACGGRGHGGGGECASLGFTECRLAPGCQPDLCPACTCGAGFRGCLPEGVTPTPCPPVGCADPVCCEKQADCAIAQGTLCAPPGTPFACGSCNSDPSTCTDDASCKRLGANQICDPIPCSCNGNRACTAGCTSDQGCQEGTTCDVASSRCIAIACTGDSECPADFRCAVPTCVRRTCTDDLECGGFCVEGQCFPARGECRPPAA